MSNKAITISIGDARFDGTLLSEDSPRTCSAFVSMLPWTLPLIHVRWSGEACWVPLGDMRLDVGHEDATSHPAPGEFIFYPGGISEAEILLAYGGVSFASKAGQLAGNRFLRISGDLDRLAEVGREILWKGARPISFSLGEA